MMRPRSTREWTLTYVQKNLNLSDQAWIQFRCFAIQLLCTNRLPNTKSIKREVDRLHLVDTLRVGLQVYTDLPSASDIVLYQCLRLLCKSQKFGALRSKSVSHQPTKIRIFPMASQPLLEDLTPPKPLIQATARSKSKSKSKRQRQRRAVDPQPLARDIFAASLRGMQSHKRSAQGLIFSQRETCAETVDLFILETMDDFREYLASPMCYPAYTSPHSPVMQQIQQDHPAASIEGLLNTYPHNNILQAQYLDTELNKHEKISISNTLNDITQPTSMSRDCWNILDFGQNGASRTPLEIQKVDACRLADATYEKARTHNLSRPEQKSYFSHMPNGTKPDSIPYKKISD